jgi:mannose-6-phosphate isomerase-like protein (cupin superfamily)
VRIHLTARARALEPTLAAAARGLNARAGDIVIVPPDTPHAFTSSGEQRLRQIDIHVSATFSTEWL